MGRGTGRLDHRNADAALPAGRGGGGGLSRRRAPERLPGIVDAHAHLQHERFDADRDTVLERAVAAGIERILVPGWDVPSSEAALELAARHPGLVHAAVGVHPHHAAATDEAGWDRLAELAREPGARAIGEIGLDFHRNLSPPDAQREALARQLALAAERGLSVVVHDREAHAEITAALLAWPGPGGAGAKGVLHAFSGDAPMAEQLVGAGYVISFALPVAFRSAAGPRDAASQVPDGSFMVETDAPYLGPDAAGRNEPITVLRVVAELGRLRGVAPETLVAPIQAGWTSLFGSHAG